MAKLSTDELLDAFKEMTLIELSEFVKMFEETFEVTAAAPVAVAAAGGAAAAPEAEAEQDEFDVVLLAAGEKKIQVIKEVRALTSLGLKEAKDLVDGAPKPVLEKVDKAAAEKAKEQLEATNGRARLRRVRALAGTTRVGWGSLWGSCRSLKAGAAAVRGASWVCGSRAAPDSVAPPHPSVAPPHPRGCAGAPSEWAVAPSKRGRPLFVGRVGSVGRGPPPTRSHQPTPRSRQRGLLGQAPLRALLGRVARVLPYAAEPTQRHTASWVRGDGRTNPGWLGCGERGRR